MALKFEPKVSIGSVISGFMAILAVVGSWVAFSNKLTEIDTRQDGQIAALEDRVASAEVTINNVALNTQRLIRVETTLTGVDRDLTRIENTLDRVEQMIASRSAYLLPPAALTTPTLAEILQR